MTSWRAAYTMYEACYRFAALSNAGIGTYEEYTTAYDNLMAQETMRKHLPSNPYDCSEDDEPRMIDSILAAYKGATNHVLYNRGIQLELWNDKPSLETLISTYRKQPSKMGSIFEGIHNDYRKHS